MSYKHLAAGFLALAASFGAFSATTADRSPFTQGHWWDSSRPGNGFEIFNVGTTGAAIWYTFEASGNPVWYTAQGELGADTWPLLKHRWVDGRRATPESVGTFKLDVRNPESARVSFDIQGQAGVWNIAPFTLSGVINEVDHSGSYFNPDNSGWGLTLTQQGDILGGVLYTYDAAGSPTWYAGFDRAAAGSVAFISARGACPTCQFVPNVTQPAGRLGFEFRSESALVIRNQVSAAMAVGVNVDGAATVQLGRKASSRPADRELVAFPTDSSLKAFLDTGMANISLPNLGFEFSSPAPPSVAFSTTNLREAGVDEADLVKTDGSTIYTFTYDDYGRRLPAIRIARVANEGASVQVAGTLALASMEVANAGLYVREGQLIALTGSQALAYGPVGIWNASGNWLRGVTNIEIFDTTGGGLPVSSWKASIEGTLVSSRRIGDRLYVVSRFVPNLTGFAYGATAAYNPVGFANNQMLLAAASLDKLLPTVRIGNGAATPLVERASILLPPQGTRPPVADMAVVYAIDLPTRRIAQSLAIVGGADTIYASTGNLYVATTRYLSRDTFGQILPNVPFVSTDIHQVRLGADALSLVASGSVEGLLSGDVDKAAFRLSEHEGRLRTVTSTAGSMWGESKNRVTVLEPSTLAPGLLKTVSYLPNAQRPESLGKPGELLYGTRFVGDRLYAVTFKMIDPLYVVDLANPQDPKIASALELPGFSEYLHPLPNGLLLGFGKDARPATTMGDGTFAWYQGLQLSLFDVSTAGSVRELQRVLIGKRGSTSALLANHHALSTLERPDGLTFAFPARVHDGDVPQYGYGDSATYPWKESGLFRYVLRGTTASDARIEPAATLITHRPAPNDNSVVPDSAYGNARSVLFREATIYTGNGQFWRQDAAGNTTGPF